MLAVADSADRNCGARILDVRNRQLRGPRELVLEGILSLDEVVLADC